MLFRYLLFISTLGLWFGSVKAQESPFFPPEDSPQTLTDAAPYTPIFAQLSTERPLTFLLYDLSQEQLLAGVDIDKQMPVVSAIKGPILLYFMAVVPPDVWDSVPAEYWASRSANEIPEAYHAAWHEHQDILRRLYRMIVYSDNFATGDALLYAYEYAGYPDLNPIQAFNQWSYDVIGISEESGMREWDQGGTNNPVWIEPRFNLRTTMIFTVPRFYNNMHSALDMARYYHWLYTQADARLYAQAVTLMSIVEGFPGFLEDAAFRLGAVPVSKDGFVGPNDRANSTGAYLTADAGLILLPEGDGLIVVSMGVNGGDKLEGIYTEIQAIIRRERQELYWPSTMDFFMWLQSETSPYENGIGPEGAHFIWGYLSELGLRPEPGQVPRATREHFMEAQRVWLSIFPDDAFPQTRNEAQNRVIAARYGGSGERLTDIALALGLIQNNNEQEPE